MLHFCYHNRSEKWLGLEQHWSGVCYQRCHGMSLAKFSHIIRPWPLLKFWSLGLTATLRETMPLKYNITWNANYDQVWRNPEAFDEFYSSMMLPQSSKFLDPSKSSRKEWVDGLDATQAFHIHSWMKSRLLGKHGIKFLRSKENPWVTTWPILILLWACNKVWYHSPFFISLPIFSI